MDIKDRIRNIPDFPKKGIMFRDITPLLGDPAYFKKSVDMMAEALAGVEFDVLAGPESRGFIFGAPLAYVMNKPFVPVRKAGKLPGEVRRAEYELEYGRAVIEVHTDAVKPGQKVVVVDDLLATGGTSWALCGMIEGMGGKIASLIFLIELEALHGREVLEDYPVKALIKY